MDCVVQFPIDNLDLQQFISGPKTKHLQYSLYSCVCHFGGKSYISVEEIFLEQKGQDKNYIPKEQSDLDLQCLSFCMLL